MNHESIPALVVERVFNAPPEMVWQALTDPQQMRKWYFDIPQFRPEIGCQFQFTGGPSPDRQYVHLCEVTEVEPNKRLAYSWKYEGYEGISYVVFTLISDKGQTLLRLTHAGLDSFPINNPDFAAVNFNNGWTNIVGVSLPEFLHAQPHLTLTRELDAPRNIVFQAWTDPVQLAQWWGPVGLELNVLRFDLRPGGMFHYSMAGPDGHTMYGRFIYREIDAPERLVFVVSFADKDGNIIRAPFADNFPLETYNILTLTELEGKTTLRLEGMPINAGENEMEFYRSMFPSMEKGFGGTFDQLTKFLKEKSQVI